MIALHVENAAKSWDGRTLFEDVQLEIAEGEHVALLGNNGVGKTTLLQAIMGKIRLTRGTIYRKHPVDQWGWIEQHVSAGEQMTLLEFVQSGAARVFELKHELERLQALLEEADAGEQQLLDKYAAVFDEYLGRGGYEWDTKVEKSLHAMQLPPEMWSMPYSKLSGGQKTRAQLAKVLLQDPPFLVLDEPTNHLDKASIDWLKAWLHQCPLTVLFVSHDRDFIDHVADVTYELTASGTMKFRGGYSEFKRQRSLQIVTQQNLHEKQERERQELLEAINRYKQWFAQSHASAKRVEARSQKGYFSSRSTKSASRFKALEKKLERLDNNRVDTYKEDPQVKLEFSESRFEARYVLRMDRVSFAYGQRSVLRNVTFHVERGDRLAIIGPNGSGKTTLVQLLIGQLAAGEGTVWRHPACRIGYFSQELQGLNTDETILDSILSLPDMTETYARTILGCFLFRRDAVHRNISALSMGEKCRVAFVKLYFSKADLLLLDEPNNYLDIQTRERIEEALCAFPGSIIVVSHDEYFLKRIANRILDVSGNEAALFNGTYSEYIDHASEGKQAKDTGTINRIQQLEHQLAQFMGQSTPDDPEEQAAMLAKVKEIKQKIEQLS